MDLIKIALTALLSIVVLFFLTKLMGKKQMSQLNMFDYINGITIGSIAAEMATSLEADFLKPLVAMIVYGIFGMMISILTSKSIKVHRFVTGKPLILFDKGKIYKKNLTTAKLDTHDFLSQCRAKGFFDLNDIQTAFMETNGHISILPQAEKRPVNPYDLGLEVEAEKAVANVILDGNIMYKNLHFMGRDENWLKKELQKQKIDDVKNVFLAICDFQGQLTVFLKIKEEVDHDIFL